MEAIQDNTDIWDRYFNDFVQHKLKLNSEESSENVAQLILRTYLGQLNELDALSRIVTLHFYMQVHQLDLAKLACVLRPLNKLRQVCLRLYMYQRYSASSYTPCMHVHVLSN